MLTVKRLNLLALLDHFVTKTRFLPKTFFKNLYFSKIVQLFFLTFQVFFSLVITFNKNLCLFLNISNFISLKFNTKIL